MTNIPIATEKRKLLIFEDEDSMQTILTEVLISDRFQVEFVSKEAIGETNSSEPELILLDHSTAPLSHAENLCEKIKSSFPTTPLIVLSAYPLNNFCNYANHMDLFIAKPFDLNHFLSSIESCLTKG
ncbi:response regulator [Pedobacter xixiisoli]|uniref:Response regulator receiver domain-containing protein n=1 Tax=Pedobacter xixiisoli TaxID=1476464 RepID=A0A285ZX04_9SPHI|nr:response regulator [Pedobacter xixiisoli]SOD14158.1 Response regulator receiver domain-containing protein [Pedobacter xixiisoli]